MNNKGFAISTMLYGLIIIILLVMLMILSTMSFNRKASREFSSNIQTRLENEEKITNNYDIKVGDYIEMRPQVTSYEYSGSGLSTTTSIDPSKLSLWRVLKIDADGIEAISHYVSDDSVRFYGATGFANYAGVLNELANAYQDSTYTKDGRMIGYKDQTKTIVQTNGFDDTPKTNNCTTTKPAENLGGGDTSYTTDVNLVMEVYGNLVAYKSNTDTTGSEYFIASRFYSGSSTTSCSYNVCKVSATGEINCGSALRSFNGSWNSGTITASIRPIIVFKPDIVQISGEGTLESPFKLS